MNNHACCRRLFHSRTCFVTAMGPLKRFPVTMNEVLLRGCMLRNSDFVHGMVIYTGPETRIQKNAAKTPLKVGAYLHNVALAA